MDDNTAYTNICVLYEMQDHLEIFGMVTKKMIYDNFDNDYNDWYCHSYWNRKERRQLEGVVKK